MVSCLTKEPSFTSFTNIKATVDYIFYDGAGIFEVVRTLDTPSYTRFLKGNLNCIPHPLMPSDHLSLLAEFMLTD
jgi:mRNA deadenylase 3'-5' endonuclease subunit Ccr4